VLRAFTAVWIAYLVAGVVAVAVAHAVPFERPLYVAAAADVAATVVVFCFSFAFRNSSFYDAYWSVAPIAIALYWVAASEAPGVSSARQVAVLALVCWWGMRLTWNWARGWRGLEHEDWRYVRLRQQTGRAYWFVSFAGIHMAPTVWVFLGCLPLYAALSTGTAAFGWIDGVATAVTAGAIWCEMTADRQLLRFRRSSPEPQRILDTGLWAWSRHPNYFGEIGFWWGLYLFGLAAAPAWWWTGIGPVSITLLFSFVSLPMIERRMLERRPAFAERQRRVSIVVPWFPRGERS
jgi:steroid 5-alpha reductase family enzyme